MNGIYPGWQTGERISLADPREAGPDEKEVGRGPLLPSAGRFKAVRLTQDGFSLEYEVAWASVHEWMEARMVEGQPVVQRRIRLERVPRQFWLVLGRSSSEVAERLKFSVTARDATNGSPAAELLVEPDGSRACVSSLQKSGRVQCGDGWTLGEHGTLRPPVTLRPPGDAGRKVLTTRGVLSQARTPTSWITFRSQPRTRGGGNSPDRHRVLHDGRAAVTFDGDVDDLRSGDDLTEVGGGDLHPVCTSQWSVCARRGGLRVRP
jgi:hypothetical protein